MSRGGRGHTLPGSRSGFTLIEILVALVILTIVILTSLSVFVERNRRMRDAEETILVWQAIANEAAITRRIPWSGLVPGRETTFRSDPAILAGIPDVVATVKVEAPSQSVREVRLHVSWRDGSKNAEALVVRTDTGGGNLW